MFRKKRPGRLRHENMIKKEEMAKRAQSLVNSVTIIVNVNSSTLPTVQQGTGPDTMTEQDYICSTIEGSSNRTEYGETTPTGNRPQNTVLPEKRKIFEKGKPGTNTEPIRHIMESTTEWFLKMMKKNRLSKEMTLDSGENGKCEIKTKTRGAQCRGPGADLRTDEHRNDPGATAHPCIVIDKLVDSEHKKQSVRPQPSFVVRAEFVDFATMENAAVKVYEPRYEMRRAKQCMWENDWKNQRNPCICPECCQGQRVKDSKRF